MHVFDEVVMTHKRIPKDWVIKRSTPFFTKENVPSALLTHHNTAAGVFGQLCVMEGTVTYYGFTDENAGKNKDRANHQYVFSCKNHDYVIINKVM